MSTPALRVNGIKYGPNDNSVCVDAYGALGNGTNDDTSAIQAAITAIGSSGGIVYIPSGNYKVTSTITISQPNVHIVCAGTLSTKFTFAAGSGAVFKFDKGSAGPLVGCSFTGGATFVATGVNQKIAIDVVDQDGFVCEDVHVDPQNASTWVGASSIGIRVRGRQLATFARIRAFCDIPILVDVDPYISSPVSCDHHHFSDLYLRPTPGNGNACFKINDGVIVTRLTIDGTNAFIVDKYGFYWVETGGTANVAQDILISNVRCEQAVDATGNAVYIDHTKGIYNLKIDNYNAGSSQNGFLIKGVTNLTLANTNSAVADATKSHLTVDRTKDLKLDNCYWQITTTATLTGLTLVRSEPQVQSGAVLPPSGWYSDTTTASKGATVNALDATSAATLSIGATTATGVALGRSGGSGVTVNDPILAFNHLKGGTSAPTIAIVGSPTQLGTGPTFASINGHDCAWNFSITTGTAPAAFSSGSVVSLATVTFNKTYTGGAPMLAILPANANAALAMAQGIQFFFNRSGSTTTTGNIRAIANGTPSLVASTVYEFVMIAIQ